MFRGRFMFPDCDLSSAHELEVHELDVVACFVRGLFTKRQERCNRGKTLCNVLLRWLVSWPAGQVSMIRIPGDCSSFGF